MIEVVRFEIDCCQHSSVVMSMLLLLATIGAQSHLVRNYGTLPVVVGGSSLGASGGGMSPTHIESIIDRARLVPRCV